MLRLSEVWYDAVTIKLTVVCCITRSSINYYLEPSCLNCTYASLHLNSTFPSNKSKLKTQDKLLTLSAVLQYLLPSPSPGVREGLAIRAPLEVAASNDSILLHKTYLSCIGVDWIFMKLQLTLDAISHDVQYCVIARFSQTVFTQHVCIANVNSLISELENTMSQFQA